MSPRTGRPPIENPKSERITIRLDRETSDILKQYCEKNKVDKAEAVRTGIKKLEADIKNKCFARLSTEGRNTYCKKLTFLKSILS